MIEMYLNQYQLQCSIYTKLYTLYNLITTSITTTIMTDSTTPLNSATKKQHPSVQINNTFYSSTRSNPIANNNNNNDHTNIYNIDKTNNSNLHNSSVTDLLNNIVTDEQLSPTLSNISDLSSNGLDNNKYIQHSMSDTNLSDISNLNYNGNDIIATDDINDIDTTDDILDQASEPTGKTYIRIDQHLVTQQSNIPCIELFVNVIYIAMYSVLTFISLQLYLQYNNLINFLCITILFEYNIVYIIYNIYQSIYYNNNISNSNSKYTLIKFISIESILYSLCILLPVNIVQTYNISNNMPLFMLRQHIILIFAFMVSLYILTQVKSYNHNTHDISIDDNNGNVVLDNTNIVLYNNIESIRQYVELLFSFMTLILGYALYNQQHNNKHNDNILLITSILYSLAIIYDAVLLRHITRILCIISLVAVEYTCILQQQQQQNVKLG